jgi:hypothetical protein
MRPIKRVPSLRFWIVFICVQSAGYLIAQLGYMKGAFMNEFRLVPFAVTVAVLLPGDLITIVPGVDQLPVIPEAALISGLNLCAWLLVWTTLIKSTKI